ncbi:RNA polymerase sigma factor [Streptomyces sp. NPDC059255]|uniref:RNA polymerase sigma factor n=1 Tax=Streptomyces sp. NPDC059255 TaxID=3346793 RepID=UPI0036AAF88F
MTDSPEQDLTRPAGLDREFSDFFTEHKGEYMRIAMSKLRNMHDADEALMDAAIKMHRKWPRIKAHPNPAALAFRIVNMAIIDFYRSRARRTGYEVPVADPVYTDIPTVDDILALRGYDRLDRALASLGECAPTQAQCVQLRYLADMSFEEIGEYLNITKGAAKTNVHLGVKKLQAFMDLTEEGDS